MIGIPTFKKYPVPNKYGYWLDCHDCLYGHVGNCPIGVRKLCADHLGWEFVYDVVHR